MVIGNFVNYFFNFHKNHKNILPQRFGAIWYGILPMYFVATSCQYYTLVVGMISSVGGVCC